MAVPKLCAHSELVAFSLRVPCLQNFPELEQQSPGGRRAARPQPEHRVPSDQGSAEAIQDEGSRGAREAGQRHPHSHSLITFTSIVNIVIIIVVVDVIIAVDVIVVVIIVVVISVKSLGHFYNKKNCLIFHLRCAHTLCLLRYATSKETCSLIRPFLFLHFCCVFVCFVYRE